MRWNAAKGKAMDVTTNGQVSFWFSDIGGLPPRRAPLPGDLSVDVCIIGAGFTGLWSAYYLKQLAPALSIAVLEKHLGRALAPLAATAGRSARGSGSMSARWKRWWAKARPGGCGTWPKRRRP